MFEHSFFKYTPTEARYYQVPHDNPSQVPFLAPYPEDKSISVLLLIGLLGIPYYSFEKLEHAYHGGPVARSDPHLKVTADDLRATRVLTLAVKFFGARRPVASSTIRADLYPELDIESFNRQYLRDRELLATFGIQVRDAGQIDGDTLWKVDELTSYVQGEGLTQDDARMLYVLCHDMAFDQSFAYRDELRMALAKISQMYRGTTLPHIDTTCRSSTTLHGTVFGLNPIPVVSIMGKRARR